MSQTCVLLFPTRESAEKALAIIAGASNGRFSETEANIRNGESYVIVALMDEPIFEYEDWLRDGEITPEMAVLVRGAAGMYCQFNDTEEMEKVVRSIASQDFVLDNGFGELIRVSDVLHHLDARGWEW